VSVRLQAFPSSDADFGAYVRACLEDLAEQRTPASLQRALRQRYPAAVVTAQEELARHGEGPTIWYAFRTAALAAPGTETEDVWPAWAIVDGERRFLEVSSGMAQIAELPARVLKGHRIEDFSNPSDPTIREDIERLWNEFLRTGSMISTVRFNYADGRPRELAYRIDADADGPGRHRLSVREVRDISVGS
jgi:PAS domain-containing protein